MPARKPTLLAVTLKIGYVRVSTQEQNTIRQEVLMAELGADEVYIDRISGKSADRPESYFAPLHREQHQGRVLPPQSWRFLTISNRR